jgi:hypothetical protein
MGYGLTLAINAVALERHKSLSERKVEVSEVACRGCLEPACDLGQAAECGEVVLDLQVAFGPEDSGKNGQQRSDFFTRL